MCREEEDITDHVTFSRKQTWKKEEIRTPESFWKRRFIIRGSESQDNYCVHQDSNVLTAYVRRKYRRKSSEREIKVNTFSTDVQELLLTMTAQFGADINQAYVSDQSQVMARGDNNPTAALLKINQIQTNMKAIDDDMRKLGAAKANGKMTAIDAFTGFSNLGENDCLLDEQSSSEDSDSDSSEDSSDSSSEDSTYSEESEARSDLDSDDESSLDSNFVNGMAKELGFDVFDQEDDESVDVSLVKALASGRICFPAKLSNEMRMQGNEWIIRGRENAISRNFKAKGISHRKREGEVVFHKFNSQNACGGSSVATTCDSSVNDSTQSCLKSPLATECADDTLLNHHDIAFDGREDPLVEPTSNTFCAVINKGHLESTRGNGPIVVSSNGHTASQGLQDDAGSKFDERSDTSKSDSSTDYDSEDDLDELDLERRLWDNLSSALPFSKNEVGKEAFTPASSSPSESAPQPSSFDVRGQQALLVSAFGLGTNVGSFDATGRPNGKAINARPYPKTGCAAVGPDLFSDLGIAARLASSLDEQGPAFFPVQCDFKVSYPCHTDTVCSQYEFCFGERCDNNLFNIDEYRTVQRESEPQCQSVIEHQDLSEGIQSSPNPGLLLVEWGERVESDSEEDECEVTPIVSTWKPNQTVVQGDSAESADSKSIILSCEKKRDAICLECPTDLELTKIENQLFEELTTTLENEENRRQSMWSPVKSALHETKSASKKLFQKSLADHSKLRRSPLRLARCTSLQPVIERQVSFQYGSLMTLVSHHDSHMGGIQEKFASQASEEKKNECEPVKQLQSSQNSKIFPRIEFHSDTKKTRRVKVGEAGSQSTRRRRKVREREIKSAMVQEQWYIDGLCALSKSQGRSVACKIKSQI